jgi:hypothetical protein
VARNKSMRQLIAVNPRRSGHFLGSTARQQMSA